MSNDALVFTFRRHQRLLHPAEFQRLFDRPDLRAGTSSFLILAAHVEHQSRLGLVVGKKKVRRAVDRNTVKRFNREYFRQHQHQYPTLDILVLVRARVCRPDRLALHEEVRQLWHKLLAKCPQP